MGMHRLRESGLAPEVMDNLDERPLKLDEVHSLCKMLFLGEYQDVDSLPHPREGWDMFYDKLSYYVEAAGVQWNSVKNKGTNLINLRKLQSDYSINGESYRVTNKNEDIFPEKKRNKKRVSSSGAARPRRHTYTQKQNPATTAVKDDLMSVIQRWGFEPPNYTTMYPLERLLVTAPRIFPVNNPEVESHEYFGKWKPFGKEAFADDDEDDQAHRELLKRGMLMPSVHIAASSYTT